MTQPAASAHAQIQELLEICEDFFAHMSPATSNEIDLLLRARGVTGGQAG